MTIRLRQLAHPLLAIFGLLSALAVLPAGRLYATAADNQLLLVHDNARAVQPLVDYLRNPGNFEVTIVDQAHLPSDWSGYRAVLGYIHNRLLEPTELAIIDYTKKGGRFIALHHMISSGKAENRYYFKFLGIQLDDPKAAKEPVQPGAGYGWYTGGEGEPGVTVTLVNLNPAHFIVAHNVHWDDTLRYQSSDQLTVTKNYPAIVLKKSEGYMNHKFTDGREKTVLCGMHYVDSRTHAVFDQDRAVWYKNYGSGRIFYFQSGHFKDEYQNPNISQMILNAIIWDVR
jgi:hypothetical protein